MDAARRDPQYALCELHRYLGNRIQRRLGSLRLQDERQQYEAHDAGTELTMEDIAKRRAEQSRAPKLVDTLISSMVNSGDEGSSVVCAPLGREELVETGGDAHDMNGSDDSQCGDNRREMFMR